MIAKCPKCHKIISLQFSIHDCKKPKSKKKAEQDKTPKQESAWPNRRYEIFQNVLNAMQAAEEIGGLEGSEYLLLMHAISTEANKRAKNAMEQEEPK